MLQGASAASAAPHCATEGFYGDIAASDTELNEFLGDPLWWPQDETPVHTGETGNFSAEALGESPNLQLAREPLKRLRLLLTEATFETLEMESSEQSFKMDNDTGDQSKGPATREKLCGGWRRRVPACFALFTRFNCNVTLVAQKFFASEIAVSVLDSGTVVVEREATVRMLKHVSSGERVYRRHVVLNVDKRDSKYMRNIKESFSYGFLVTFLEALPPSACKLVLSESLPFGRILDQCRVNRSVEVEKQLHIHVGEGLFSPDFLNLRAEGSAKAVSLPTARTESGCQENTQEYAMPLSGECRCRIMPKGMSCTFGRLTTIRCDGRLAARVVEILNAELLLSALVELEEEYQRREKKHASPACHSPDGGLQSGVQRSDILANRCLLSVALCPVHYGALPKPHMTAEHLHAQRKADEGCRLCGSTTCSTDFRAANAQDLP